MCPPTDQGSYFFILYIKIMWSPRGEKETEIFILGEIFEI